MPDLTPPLPAQYRHSALVALDWMMVQAEANVEQHLASIERLAVARKRTTSARIALGFAKDRLALLGDRQRFLLSREIVQNRA
jgi:hypothetical protein